MRRTLVTTLALVALCPTARLGAAEDPFAGVAAGEEVIHVYTTRFGLHPAAAAPPRAEGVGPFARLVIRGATLIDGTGAPPVGPVDIVVEQDRIVREALGLTQSR